MFVQKRNRVTESRAGGSSAREIAGTLGVSRSTVCYHLRRGGQAPDERFSRRYDWAAVQRYYDEGRSIAACRERFGFSRGTWTDAALRGDVVSRPQGMPLEELWRGRGAKAI